MRRFAMISRSLIALSALLLVVACGGGTAATPAPSLAPGQTPGPEATSAPPPPQAGEDITGETIVAAHAALNALDSWPFETTFWIRGFEQNFEQTVDGTHRNEPEVATEATHSSPNGDFHFIRIGDDIWTTLGTSEYYHYDAVGSENLLEQYESFYIAALIGAVDRSQLDFEPVAV